MVDSQLTPGNRESDRPGDEPEKDETTGVVSAKLLSQKLQNDDVGFSTGKTFSGWVLKLAAVTARHIPGWAVRVIYWIKPLAKGIRRSLNRAAKQINPEQRFTTVTVAAGALAGIRMLLDLQAEKDYWLGTYEMELQQAVIDWVKPGWVVYDVGANIGYVTLMLAKAVGRWGKVIAFEALPANVERLKQNIALNDYDLAKIQVVPAAVVDRCGQVQFLVGPSDDMGKVVGSAGRSNLPYSEKILVEAISLDEYVMQGNCESITQGGDLQGKCESITQGGDLVGSRDRTLAVPQAVKMDIEGGEILAIPGMRRLLAQVQPVLLLELHGETAAQTCWQELKATGYRIFRMQPGYPEVHSLNEIDWKSYLVAYADQPEGK